MSSQRSELEKSIIEKAMKDSDFREKLKNDPKGTLEEVVGGKFPDEMKIHVNEEDANNVHITLPHNAEEISDEELSGVSGGWSISSGSGHNCNDDPALTLAAKV